MINDQKFKFCVGGVCVCNDHISSPQKIPMLFLSFSDNMLEGDHNYTFSKK